MTDIREIVERQGVQAALEDVRTAAIIDFDNEDAQSNFLQAARQSGDIQATTEALQWLVRLRPYDPQKRNLLVSALLKQGRAREACIHAEAVLRTAPDLPDAWCNYGAALLGSGNKPGAARAYRRALQLDGGLQAARLALEHPLKDF